MAMSSHRCQMHTCSGRPSALCHLPFLPIISIIIIIILLLIIAACIAPHRMQLLILTYISDIAPPTRDWTHTMKAMAMVMVMKTRAKPCSNICMVLCMKHDVRNSIDKLWIIMDSLPHIDVPIQFMFKFTFRKNIHRTHTPPRLCHSPPVMVDFSARSVCAGASNW